MVKKVNAIHTIDSIKLVKRIDYGTNIKDSEEKIQKQRQILMKN